MTPVVARLPARPAANGVVIAATFGVVAVGVVAGVAVPGLKAPVIPVGVIVLSWWALALMYALALSLDVVVTVRREAQMLTLTEVPLVLGLMFASPTQLLLGRMAGAFVAHALYRRQYREPLKLAFNMAWVLETCVAVALFRIFMNGHAIGDWRSWVAACLASMFVALIAAFVVSAVISYVEGAGGRWPFASAARHAVVEALMMTTVGVVSAQALFGNKWAAVPLAGLGLVLWFAYRAYGVLHERHLSLERLYR
ncbi:MAG: putative Diguanylate cyclase/phosphodiesterase, partial [Frankiales bacterium]|nr:putative Diguanylate cyclase/phosphodiesterase [Frankiales bacterium]